MKKKTKIISALVALTAIMTGCSDDNAVEQQSNETLANAPSITVSLGDATGTRAGIHSEEGGWTNFKENAADMQDNYDLRVTLHLFAQNNPTSPIVKWTKTYSYAELNTAGAITSGAITIDGLRIPAGNTYSAVTWVDFVNHGTTTGVYDVDNLSSVVYNADPSVENGEARDAYTGLTTFTMDADGSVSEASINITAKRALAKVRLVLTDYDTKAEWDSYFSGQDVNCVLGAVGMKVSNLSTTYDAVSQAPVASTGTENLFFKTATYNVAGSTIEWIYCDAIGDNAKSITEGGYADLDAAEADGKKVYPVLDFNYFIPASNEASAVYDMGFASYANPTATLPTTFPTAVTVQGATPVDWAVLSRFELSSIPVRKNVLTTLWGNFITKSTPHFIVTLTDHFDNLIDRVIVADNGAVSLTMDIDGATVQINRDAAGVITSIVVDGIDSSNWQSVLTQLNSLTAWDDTVSELTINTTTYVGDLSTFTGAVKKTTVNMTAALTSADAITVPANILALEVVNAANQTQPLTISSASTPVAISGTNTLGDLTLQGAAAKTINANVGGTTTVSDGELTVNGGTFTGAVTANSPLTVNNGTINGDVTANDNIAINGGTFSGKIDANADVTADGGTINTLWMNTADSQITLNVNLGGDIKIGSSVASTATVYITGTETGAGHTYNNSTLTDSRWTWTARP